MGAVTDGEAAAGCGDAGEAGQCGAPGLLGSREWGWGAPGTAAELGEPREMHCVAQGASQVGPTGRALGPRSSERGGARTPSWGQAPAGTGASGGPLGKCTWTTYKIRSAGWNRRLRPRRLRKGPWGGGWFAGLGGLGGDGLDWDEGWRTVGVCGLKAEIKGRFGGGVDISDGQPEPEFALVPTW